MYCPSKLAISILKRFPHALLCDPNLHHEGHGCPALAQGFGGDDKK
jgi:hypothetical protein